MTTPQPTFEERLARFLPAAIVLRKTPEGRYEGLVEHSFSMGWNKHRTLIYWSGKAFSILGEHMLDGLADAARGAQTMGGEAFDVMSPECPVQVDLASWLEQWENNGSKFDCRNAFFEQR